MSDRPHAAVLHERLGSYEFECGGGDTFLVAFERAVALVPAQPPSRERARALEALAHGLALLWRYDESLALCEQALELARTVGARETELRALTTLGSDLAYLGRVTTASRISRRPSSSPPAIPTPCTAPTSPSLTR